MPGALVTVSGLFPLFSGLRVSARMDGLFWSGVGMDGSAGQHELHEESSSERDHERQHKSAFVKNSAHRRKGPGIELEQQNHVSSMIDRPSSEV